VLDLMPRIRNWKDLLFFRPSRSAWTSPTRSENH
jgi:hypothetical protein